MQKILESHGFVSQFLTANDGSKFVGWSKGLDVCEYCGGVRKQCEEFTMHKLAHFEDCGNCDQV